MLFQNILLVLQTQTTRTSQRIPLMGRSYPGIALACRQSMPSISGLTANVLPESRNPEPGSRTTSSHEDWWISRKYLGDVDSRMLRELLKQVPNVHERVEFSMYFRFRIPFVQMSPLEFNTWINR